jgi:hypothetical protein
LNVALCSIGLGGWYPRGVARLVESVAIHSPSVSLMAWINTLPFGAPAGVLEVDNDFYCDYTAYCAKPFTLAAARAAGADIAILCDAAFFAIRDIQPLVDHIAQTGYYFCRNGMKLGEWSSDRCLERMGMTREEAWNSEEISSYCVGVNFSDGRMIRLLERWIGFAADRLTIPGPHSNEHSVTGRNHGFVSFDPRVRGHRHDQTVLSILAHQMGLHELVNRPRFTAYSGSETSETVLVNQGGAW